jgi:hypothetical protein
MFLKRVRLALVAATISLLAASALADEFADGIAAFDRGDFSAAHLLLMPLAEQGDPRAAIVVAGDFYVGWGVPPNDAKADEWRRRAQASASPTDFGPVISRWRRMAEAGDAAAQAMLGAAYYAGFGVPMDPKEAVQWIRAAADHGHVRGQYALGELYLAGEGVPRDVPEAIKWFRLAAAQGDASAQLKLGTLAEKGFVPGHAPPDDAQALERYRLAAAGGNPLAQMRLGEIYLRGEVVTQDPVAAYQWLVLASATPTRLPDELQQELQALLGWAEAVLTDSQERAALYSLGEKCRDGSGVPQDDVLAYRFMDMAAQGETDTLLADQVRGARDQLAERMRPETVAKAQMMSRGRARPSTAQPGSTRPTTAPTTFTSGEDCLFVTVRPSLRNVVRVAADKVQPPLVIRFEGDPGAELCERSVELTFSLTVDRSSQSENWEDTEGADAEVVLLGALLPWPCPTTHTLLAVVRNRAGDQLDSFEVSRLEERTGTILTCTNESGPSDSIATKLVRDVLRRLTASTKSPAGVGGL